MTTLKEQKSELLPLLQKAMELELSTIPPYLTAWLSIHKDPKKHDNHVAANLIHSVMMEEMLHMVLVGNLISSLGCKVSLGETNIPSYPLKMNFQDRNFPVDLTAFSPDAIETFLKIEKPGDISLAFGAFSEIDVPAVTIGEFYADLINKLNKMCDEFGESAVFCGDPSKQIAENYYWGANGKPIIITDKNSADQALKIIITQGEGSDSSIFIATKDNEQYFQPPQEVAHFFRFMEIYCHRYYSSTDKPEDYPTGESFSLDYKDVFPIKKNAKSSDYESSPQLAKLNDNFNRQYSLMLIQLEQAFNGTPSVLYHAIVSGMHSMVSIAMEMRSLKISDDGDQTSGAPSFEWNSPPILDFRVTAQNKLGKLRIKKQTKKLKKRAMKRT